MKNAEEWNSFALNDNKMNVNVCETEKTFESTRRLNNGNGIFVYIDPVLNLPLNQREVNKNGKIVFFRLKYILSAIVHLQFSFSSIISHAI